MVREGSVEESIIGPTVQSERKKRNIRAEILLVEDNQINRDMVTAMIQMLGHTVITAGNGLEALDVLEEYEPDLQMPELDGFQTTERIRQSPNPRIANIPIVALTAHAFQEYMDRCLEAGMNNFISKPIQMQLLRKAIDEVLSKKAPAPLDQADQATQGTDAGQASSAVFDTEVFETNMDKNPMLIQRACDSFLQHADQYLREMEDAVGRRDIEVVSRIGHSLKSIAATFGSADTQHVALALQNSAPGPDDPMGPDWPRVLDLHQKLHWLVIQLREQVAAYQAKSQKA